MLQKTVEIVSSGWLDANNTGVVFPPEMTFLLQNQNTKSLIAQQSPVKPEDDDFTGEVIKNLTFRESSKIITPEANSGTLWVRNTTKGEDSLTFYMQEWLF